MLISSVLSEIDSVLKRDIYERQTVLPFLRNVELKYKLLDLEVALTEAHIHLSVSGYIRSDRKHKVDSRNLLCWYEAE